MPSETVVSEARIHFELYRLLKNLILSGDERRLSQYSAVHPEYPVLILPKSKQKGSADLVVDVLSNNSAIPFLVIEVKKKTKPGLTTFTDDAEKQAKGYAEGLRKTRGVKASYYAITDGSVLRLFKTAGEHLGDYDWSLVFDELSGKDGIKVMKENEKRIKRFLEGLSQIHAGKSGILSFPISSRVKEIEEGSINLAETLRKIFAELGGEDNKVAMSKDKARPHMAYLHVGKLKKSILHLSSSRKDLFIDIRLDTLRKVLGQKKYDKHLGKLYEVPGFGWVKENIEANESTNTARPLNNTWKNLKDIIAEDISSDDLKNGLLKKRLKNWVLELAGNVS